MIPIRELALDGAHTDTTGYAICLQVEYPFRIGTWCGPYWGPVTSSAMKLLRRLECIPLSLPLARIELAIC